MTTTIHLNETELDQQFLEAIKTLFKNRDLAVTIEVEDRNDTTHLLSNPVNRERLLQSVKNINENTNLTDINLDQLKTMVTDA